MLIKIYPVLCSNILAGSQQVNNRLEQLGDDYWFASLTQKDILACVDGRGTGFKGAAFKKVTQKNWVNTEVIDQIDAAKVLGSYSLLTNQE